MSESIASQVPSRSRSSGLNAKISNDFEHGEKNFLTLGFQSSFSAERYPKYSSQFTDGTLVVKESIDQILSNTIETSYTNILTENNFLGKIYAGGSTFENYNKKIEVEARGFNSDINNKNNQTWSGYHAGISLANNHSIFNFEFDARYENQEGLIDKAATFTANLIF